jgi:hypothetical protein
MRADLFSRDLLEWAEVPDPGVVDEYVDAVGAFDHGRNRRGDGRVVEHVEWQDCRVGAGVGQRFA